MASYLTNHYVTDRMASLGQQRQGREHASVIIILKDSYFVLRTCDCTYAHFQTGLCVEGRIKFCSGNLHKTVYACLNGQFSSAALFGRP
eukprot:1062769-Pyramimonas_sp.AAC.1